MAPFHRLAVRVGQQSAGFCVDLVPFLRWDEEQSPCISQGENIYTDLSRYLLRGAHTDTSCLARGVSVTALSTEPTFANCPSPSFGVVVGRCFLQLSYSQG